MVIPEFRNVQYASTEQIRQRLSVLRPERVIISEKFYHGSVLVLDSSAVRDPAHKAGDPVPSPGPG